MSDCYVQPYEPLNSTAKLIRLPKQRSKSIGRSFWSRIINSSSFSSQPSPPLRKDESPTPAKRPQIMTAITPDENIQRNSRLNTGAFHCSSGQPMIRPRTSISGRLESNGVTKQSFSKTCNEEPRKISSPHPKTKTTITVHLSKTSQTNSTPNLLESNRPEGSQRILEKNDRRSSDSQNWSRPIQERNRSFSMGSFSNLDKAELFQSSLGQNLSETEELPPLELNSLKVFRQPKYRERKKAERRIRQLEHLKQNSECSELVNQLGKAFHPSTYENQNTLSLVSFINQEGFITSSKVPATKHLPTKAKFPPPLPPPLPPPPVQRRNMFRDHVYAEINEDELTTMRERNVRTPPPIFKKRVTFSTFHEPISKWDSFLQNKKILPATFCGIVQVTEALRSKADADRRKIALLCYHAIATEADDFSLRFLGKVDSSRRGESVYLILEESHFEIRDGDGFVIVKHRFSDISVVTQIEDDACIFVYVGRCKFNGRVGVAIRFGKSKHLCLVLSHFNKK